MQLARQNGGSYQIVSMQVSANVALEDSKEIADLLEVKEEPVIQLKVMTEKKHYNNIPDITGGGGNEGQWGGIPKQEVGFVR